MNQGKTHAEEAQSTEFPSSKSVLLQTVRRSPSRSNLASTNVVRAALTRLFESAKTVQEKMSPALNFPAVISRPAVDSLTYRETVYGISLKSD